MWTSLILVVLVAALVVVWHVIINVKPNVDRPVLDDRAEQEIAALAPRLMGHVRTLAVDIGPRSLDELSALERAAEYVRREWKAQGYAPRDETYTVDGQSCANVIIEKPGGSAAGEIIVVGAHYDSVAGQPGANDNASGVAALLEVSRALKSASLARTVRFVAFVNEEPPHFKSEHMGSRVHARAAKKRGERIVAMLSLETLGCYSKAANSQSYPFPFSLFYPSVGDFVAVVGNVSSRSLVIETLRALMTNSDVPFEGVASPGSIPGIGWSDHASFWEEGYPAVMLTDTAPFRYPHYHRMSDLPDQIDSATFARAAHAIVGAVVSLAGRD